MQNKVNEVIYNYQIKSKFTVLIRSRHSGHSSLLSNRKQRPPLLQLQPK